MHDSKKHHGRLEDGGRPSHVYDSLGQAHVRQPEPNAQVLESLTKLGGHVGRHETYIERRN